MSDDLIPVPAEWAEKAWCSDAQYQDMYRRSVEDPEGFWAEHGQRVDWIKPYNQIKDVSYDAGDLHIKWFHDGTLNASANCLDRHLEKRGDQVAIIWEGDEPTVDKKITYRELHELVCKFANGLKSIGVKKGDRVTIYLPMIPEIAVAVLACARIGAIHSVVFGGFSPEALAGRITRLRLQRRHHGRRGRARRPADSAEGQYRRGAEIDAVDREMRGGPTYRRRHRLERTAATSGTTT